MKTLGFEDTVETFRLVEPPGPQALDFLSAVVKRVENKLNPLSGAPATATVTKIGGYS